MKVHISPPLASIKDDNGIGRVIHAQHKYLPEFGIDLVDLQHADIIAAHVNADNLPRIDVLHCHGLYWTDEHGRYTRWHHDANQRIIEAARRARYITVPSEWVAGVFKRDFRIKPHVIGHGIDLDSVDPFQENAGYILWNKNRAEDVCDPTPAYELAQRGLPVVSTFAPPGKSSPDLRVIGPQTHLDMMYLVGHALMYLATTEETFGIGTLEALASGVPVLGYSWGGTSDLVRHKIDGYLVEPGDIDGLLEGAEWIRGNREALAKHARERAKDFSWQSVCRDYAALYAKAHDTTPERTGRDGVSVVITCYNYQDFVGDCIQSIAHQTTPPRELIVVNDGSTDSSLVAIQNALSVVDRTKTKVILLDQENQGVAAARNNGLKVATQDYVICLDADDMLAEQYLEALHKPMKQDRGLGVAYTGLQIINADNSVWGQTGWPPEFSWEAQSTLSTPPSNCVPSAAMFRRDMWVRAGGIKQIYAPAEDAEFWTRGLATGFRAKRITDLPLFFYRSHGKGAHVTRTYKSVDMWLPWIRDKQYPIGAPARSIPRINSYAHPVVSVVIPVGPNHIQYLPAAIDSVLGQTLRQWELIVVNDTGQTLNFPEYPFLKIVPSEARHPGAARNLGIAQAKAPFIYFLDADDFMHPTTLEKSLRLFTETGKYVYSDWVAVDGEQQEIHPTREYNQAEVVNSLPHAVNTLIPTSWAKEVGFSETLEGWEEWAFYASLAKRGYCGIRLPEPLLYYRTQTGTVRKKSFEHQKALRAFIQKEYGGEQMGCCGGTQAGEAIITAKSILNRAFRSEEPSSDQPPTIQGAQKVRMRFIGDQAGTQTWKSQIQRHNRERWYQGAKDGIHEFVDAHVDDVSMLESTGYWKVVEMPAPDTRGFEPQGIVMPTVVTVPVVRQTQVPAPVPAVETGFNALDPNELTGELPPGVQKLTGEQAQPEKKKPGRPRKGYVEEL